jgi:hypothetical protein
MRKLSWHPLGTVDFKNQECNDDRESRVAETRRVSANFIF